MKCVNKMFRVSDESLRLGVGFRKNSTAVKTTAMASTVPSAQVIVSFIFYGLLLVGYSAGAQE